MASPATSTLPRAEPSPPGAVGVDAMHRGRGFSPVSRAGAAPHFPCAAAAVLTVLLAPAVLRLAAGGGPQQRTGLTLLTLETLYVFGAAACWGATRIARSERVQAAAFLALPPMLICAAGVVLGWDAGALLVAQPTIAATALYGWGIGRVARRLGRGPAAASVLVWLLASLALVGVLPLSHLAEPLSSRPWLGEILLAANPLVAVTAAAGLDPLRTEGLYAALTLSEYRFDYPGPVTSPAVLATLGMLLVAAVTLRRPASHGDGARQTNEEVCS